MKNKEYFVKSLLFAWIGAMLFCLLINVLLSNINFHINPLNMDIKLPHADFIDCIVYQWAIFVAYDLYKGKLKYET